MVIWQYVTAEGLEAVQSTITPALWQGWGESGFCLCSSSFVQREGEGQHFWKCTGVWNDGLLLVQGFYVKRQSIDVLVKVVQVLRRQTGATNKACWLLYSILQQHSLLQNQTGNKKHTYLYFERAIAVRLSTNTNQSLLSKRAQWFIRKILIQIGMIQLCNHSCMAVGQNNTVVVMSISQLNVPQPQQTD